MPPEDQSPPNRDFWRTLFDFLSGDKASFEHDPHKFFSFAVACAAVGILVVILDLIATKLRGRSFLTVGYAGIGKTLLVIVLWGIGASIGGYFAAVIDIVRMNMQGCLFIGAGWPLVLPRILSSAQVQIQDEQK